MKASDKLNFIIDDLDSILIKNFWFVKDTVKQIKPQSAGVEEVCAQRICDIGLVSRIHKEFFQLDKKTKQN